MASLANSKIVRRQALQVVKPEINIFGTVVFGALGSTSEMKVLEKFKGDDSKVTIIIFN